jgi:hypothetical protein
MVRYPGLVAKAETCPRPFTSLARVGPDQLADVDQPCNISSSVRLEYDITVGAAGHVSLGKDVYFTFGAGPSTDDVPGMLRYIMLLGQGRFFTVTEAEVSYCPLSYTDQGTVYLAVASYEEIIAVDDVRTLGGFPNTVVSAASNGIKIRVTTRDFQNWAGGVGRPDGALRSPWTYSYDSWLKIRETTLNHPFGVGLALRDAEQLLKDKTSPFNIGRLIIGLEISVRQLEIGSFGKLTPLTLLSRGVSGKGISGVSGGVRKLFRLDHGSPVTLTGGVSALRQSIALKRIIKQPDLFLKAGVAQIPVSLGSFADVAAGVITGAKKIFGFLTGNDVDPDGSPWNLSALDVNFLTVLPPGSVTAGSCSISDSSGRIISPLGIIWNFSDTFDTISYSDGSTTLIKSRRNSPILGFRYCSYFSAPTLDSATDETHMLATGISPGLGSYGGAGFSWSSDAIGAAPLLGTILRYRSVEPSAGDSGFLDTLSNVVSKVASGAGTLAKFAGAAVNLLTSDGRDAGASERLYVAGMTREGLNDSQVTGTRLEIPQDYYKVNFQDYNPAATFRYSTAYMQDRTPTPDTARVKIDLSCKLTWTGIVGQLDEASWLVQNPPGAMPCPGPGFAGPVVCPVTSPQITAGIVCDVVVLHTLAEKASTIRPVDYTPLYTFGAVGSSSEIPVPIRVLANTPVTVLHDGKLDKLAWIAEVEVNNDVTLSQVSAFPQAYRDEHGNMVDYKSTDNIAWMFGFYIRAYISTPHDFNMLSGPGAQYWRPAPIVYAVNHPQDLTFTGPYGTATFSNPGSDKAIYPILEMAAPCIANGFVSTDDRMAEGGVSISNLSLGIENLLPSANY